MGRFRAVFEDDDDDDDDVVDSNDDRAKHQWEFVAADPNETRALCLRESEDNTLRQGDGADDDETDTVPMRSLSSSDKSYQATSNTMMEWFLEQQRYRDVALRHEWEQQQRKNRSCNGGVKLLALALFVALVAMCWNDPPPAPPPPPLSLFRSSTTADATTSSTTTTGTTSATRDTPMTGAHLTWTNYLTVHGRQFMEAATALGVATPRHILYWTVKSMVTDLVLKYEDVRSWSLPVLAHWILRRPPESSCSWNPQSLETDWNADELIIGQTLAVEWLYDAVKAWGSSSSTITDMSPATSAAGLQRPLIVLATGHAHTGKRTLAHALMNQLYYGSTGSSSSSCTAATSAVDSMILHLHGADWTLDAHGIDHHSSMASTTTMTRTNLLFQKLALTIESHVLSVRRSSGGASSSSPLLILLTNMDAMDIDVLSRLLVAVSVPLTTPHHYPSATLIQPDLNALCRHSILFLTSDSLGVKAITRSLRIGRGDLHSVVASVSADLNDAVAQHFVSATAPSLSNPQKWISSILPFVPLTDQTLPSLLKRRVSQLCPSLDSSSSASSDPPCPCQVMVTTEAIRHVLHESRVEYIEWNFSPLPRPVSTTESSDDDALPRPLRIKMVLDGASVLNDQSPIMTKLGAQMRPLLPPQCQTDETTMPLPPRVLVLDYDARSLLESKRGVLQWCDASSDGEALQGCREVQRFRM